MIQRFMPNTLQRYVLREFWKVFLLALAACTLFFLLVTLFVTASEWEEYGITLSQVAMLFPYLLPKPMAYAIPLAVLIAATMVIGRLCAENEILAAQAGGAPIRILAWPVLLSGLAMCGASLWCTQGGLHWGYSTIKDDVLKLNKPEAFLKNLQKEGTSFSIPLEGGEALRINMLPHVVDPATGHVRKPIHISYFSGQDVGRTFLAEDYDYDSSQIGKADRTLTLRLKNMQVLGSEPAFFGEIVKPFTMPRLEKVINIDDSRGKRGWMQNWREASETRQSIELRRRFLLQRASDLGAMAAAGAPLDAAAPVLGAAAWCDARIASDAIYAQGGALDRIRASESECFRKLSLSLIPLSMAMLGIGLGLLVRKSQLLIGFLLGIVFYALAYYPLMIVCKELSVAGSAGLWVLWLPNLVLLLLGYSLWRAYERGWLGSLPPWLASFGPKASAAGARAARAIWRPFAALRDLLIGLLRYKTDGYIAGAFLVPLLVVLVSMASLFTALDLVEHGGEVVDSIVRAGESRGLIEARSTATAMLDVLSYYCIRALEVTCDLLPLLILIAGVLCVFTLVRSNEHLILKSSGVRLQRAFRPIIVIALAVSIGVTLLRETLLPGLMLQRDYLKPRVYHRNPAPSALALHTTDMNGNPVLFQMSQYSSANRTGRDLRVYLLDEAHQHRIPAIIADKAVWNGAGWLLKTERDRDGNGPPLSIFSSNAKSATAKAEPRGTGGKGDKGGQPAHGGSKADSGAFLDHGYLVHAASDAPSSVPEREPVNNLKTPLAEWRGGVTPAIIESDRLGPAVMSLRELGAVSGVKRDYAVEFYHRAFEVLMAVFLLWASLPLLLKEEARHQFLGIGLSIALAALYWGLNMGVAEAARESYLPAWALVLPHALFLAIGFRNYYLRMET